MGNRQPCPECNAGLHSVTVMDECDYCGHTGWVTYGKPKPKKERSMGWKYIIIRKGNQELPIIFPDSMVHSLMFKCIRAMTKAEIRSVYPMATKKMLEDAADALIPVSAGSITFDVGSATGGSETLGVQARAEDAAAIQAFPYTHGIMFNDEGN